MALLSLLIDEHSSLKDGELYVTFQDGIVYESGNVKNKQKHT